MKCKLGDKVKCIDAEMEGCGPCLTQNRIYTVAEYCPPERCENVTNLGYPIDWKANGGWVRLLEEGKPPANRFFGRRFEMVT